MPLPQQLNHYDFQNLRLRLRRPSDPQIETQRVETPYTKCRGSQTLRLSDPQTLRLSDLHIQFFLKNHANM